LFAALYVCRCRSRLAGVIRRAGGSGSTFAANGGTLPPCADTPGSKQIDAPAEKSEQCEHCKASGELCVRHGGRWADRPRREVPQNPLPGSCPSRSRSPCPRRFQLCSRRRLRGAATGTPRHPRTLTSDLTDAANASNARRTTRTLCVPHCRLKSIGNW
jgi:hypothetical protein